MDPPTNALDQYVIDRVSGQLQEMLGPRYHDLHLKVRLVQPPAYAVVPVSHGQHHVLEVRALSAAAGGTGLQPQAFTKLVDEALFNIRVAGTPRERGACGQFSRMDTPQWSTLRSARALQSPPEYGQGELSVGGAGMIC